MTLNALTCHNITNNILKAKRMHAKVSSIANLVFQDFVWATHYACWTQIFNQQNLGISMVSVV